MTVLPAYRGNQAANVYRLGRREPAVVDAVHGVLRHSYELYLGPVGRRFVDECFDRLRAAGDGDLEALFAGCRETFGAAGLDRYANGYKQASLRRTIALLGPDHFRGDVADVGCGSNALGAELLGVAPQVRTVTGVDPIPAPPSADDRLRFVLQQRPDRVPLPDAGVDVAVLRYALHHVRHEVQLDLLRDLRRALRPGGVVLVVEDTFSRVRPPLATNVPLGDLLRLPDDGIVLALALLDASSCLVEEETMDFPFAFRSMEEWAEVFGAAGYQPLAAEFWGLPFFSLYQAPMGVLRFRVSDEP